MIGPVVISSTSAYRRVPEIRDTRIDGDLATVWALTSSETVDRSGKAQQNKFSEVYLLVKTAGGWQIGAMADNRGASAFAGAPTAPASPK
jgi:ketosteroid isomerase-like protein